MSLASNSVRPKPPRPKSSPAINALQPNAQAKRAPVKAAGIEAGIITFQTNSEPLYPIVLAALINIGWTFFIPIRMFIVMAHVPPRTIIKMIGVFPCEPNRIRAIGSQTILGIDCKAITKEPIVSSANFDCPNKIPRAEPIIIANVKPRLIRCKLVISALLKIPDSKNPLYNCSIAPLGEGENRVVRNSKFKFNLYMLSHIAIRTVKKTSLFRVVVITHFLLHNFLDFTS